MGEQMERIKFFAFGFKLDYTTVQQKFGFENI